MFDAALVTKHVTENPFVLLRAIIIWHLLKIFGGYTVADVTSTKDGTFQEPDFPDVIDLLTGNGSDLRFDANLKSVRLWNSKWHVAAVEVPDWNSIEVSKKVSFPDLHGSGGAERRTATGTK